MLNMVFLQPHCAKHNLDHLAILETPRATLNDALKYFNNLLYYKCYVLGGARDWILICYIQSMSLYFYTISPSFLFKFELSSRFYISRKLQILKLFFKFTEVTNGIKKALILENMAHSWVMIFNIFCDFLV